MYLRHLFYLVLTLALPSTAMSATYSLMEIEKIQGEGIDDPYNTVHVKSDITDSPCPSTNEVDRFAIVNNVQQSIALAALMAGKKITIQTSSSCNVSGIAVINFIMIYADH